MAIVTLQQLRDRVRQRANMENSSFVTDAELNVYINEAISDLRDKMISKVGEDYFANVHNFTLISDQEAYNLPADFYKILYVEQKIDNNFFTKVKRFEIAERNNFNDIAYFNNALRYRLRANQIIFSPVSSIGGKQIRLTYVPVPSELVNNTDQLQGYNGWESYVVVYAARKALVKEESDTSQLDQELIRIEQRLETMIDNRDQAEPARIYDNSKRFNYFLR